MSYLIVGHIDPERIDLRTKEKVKEYIIKTSRNQEARWPGVYCTIWNHDKGISISVMAGSYYSNSDTEIYLRHNPGGEVPNWVPGALSAVAEFFGILQDPEVNQAIITVAINIAVGLFKPLQANVAQTFGGIPVVRLAINSRDHLLAGEYPPSEDDPEGVPIWRLHLSGEPVNIDDPEWTSFSLSS